MRISTKLALMELFLIFGFLVALGVVVFFAGSIIKLKDFELASNNVMFSMKEMNFQSASLMIATTPVIETSSRWTSSINRFERQLDSLSNFAHGRVLTAHQKNQLIEISGWWNQIYEWYYRPAIRQLQNMHNSESGNTVGNKGILQTLIELENLAGEPPDFIGELYTMKNYQDLIIDETRIFSDRMNTLTQSIQNQALLHVRTSTRIVLFLLLFTLSITIIITTRFGRLMSKRIRQVEEAIRNIAQGDFSTELHINSKDEMEELSGNYNLLKNQLRERLNSILGFMVSISSSLSEGPDLESILKLIAKSAKENTGADGSAVYLLGGEEKVLHPRAFNGHMPPPFPVSGGIADDPQGLLEFLQQHSIPLGQQLIGKTVQEGKPVFLRSLENRETGSVEFYRRKGDPLYISSLIITPLMISTRLIGAIVIVKRKEDTQFTDLDFTHMQTFADYAALTIDNVFNYEELIKKRELHREIEIAADIQKDLLPRGIPRMAGIQVSAFSRAARGISGDYYDVFAIDKKRLALVICDVVGKGVPASLLMVMIRTIIRLVSSPTRSPSQLLTLLNRGIIGRIGTDHFATMSIFFYNRENREITYSNAAHPPLLIYRTKEKKFIEIDTAGLPIGVERKEHYEDKSLKAIPEDLLVLFTDGVPETRAPDGSEYGEESLRKVLARSHKSSAKEITELVEEDLRRYSGQAERHDDQTIVVLKVVD